MTDKRQYPRHQCNFKSKFNYYIGNPDEIDFDELTPNKGKGVIHDISKGGIFIISSNRVAPGMPIEVQFKTRKNKLQIMGKIVRTGLLKNNPTELAKKFLKFSSSGDSYIAVQFNNTIDISADDL